MLEQLIEAVRGLPPEGQRHLWEWLVQQERQNAEEQRREAAMRQQLDRYRISYGTDGGHVYDEAKAAGMEILFLLHIVEEKEPFYAGVNHDLHAQLRRCSPVRHDGKGDSGGLECGWATFILREGCIGSLELRLS